MTDSKLNWTVVFIGIPVRWGIRLLMGIFLILYVFGGNASAGSIYIPLVVYDFIYLFVVLVNYHKIKTGPLIVLIIEVVLVIFHTIFHLYLGVFN